MSNHYGFMIESMVSILLLLTILYCVRLNKQLRLLKADEKSLRATIAELITATEIAERAIGGLKSTMREAEQPLAARLEDAERLTSDLSRQLMAGEELLSRFARLVAAARNPGVPPVVDRSLTPPDAKAVAAAADAFAARARARASGLAA
ncbi:MAG TPA: DUF6468 domain-containing protein [Pseudolabrys sp.]|nr:DUF6468 domain-containing protein [Pseudolabrys sp.]